MYVPTNVYILLNIPSIPTILFVAAAIIVILDIIKNVSPPFDWINSVTHGIKPSVKIDLCDGCTPPWSAKETDVKIAPIMNKNKNPLKKARFSGLWDSEGRITLSVIFRPYRKPIPKDGANIKSIIKGLCFISLSISGPNMKYETRASAVAPTNIEMSIQLLFFLTSRSVPHSSNLICCLIVY